MKVGDIKILPKNSGDGYFIVEVVNLFTDEGVEYAEVKPVDFNGFTREVETSKLLDTIPALTNGYIITALTGFSFNDIQKYLYAPQADKVYSWWNEPYKGVNNEK